MPEPIPSAAITLGAQALVVAPLTFAGVGLGLRADVLLAGFCGAVAAMALLNSVPGTGDTLSELVRTSLRRVGVSVGSAVTAGYIAPLLSLINGVPEPLMLSVAFVAGAGAQQILPWLIERFGRGPGARPPPAPPPGDEGEGGGDGVPPRRSGWSTFRRGGGQ